MTNCITCIYIIINNLKHFCFQSDSVKNGNLLILFQQDQITNSRERRLQIPCERKQIINTREWRFPDSLEYEYKVCWVLGRCVWTGTGTLWQSTCPSASAPWLNGPMLSWTGGQTWSSYPCTTPPDTSQKEYTF